jgi:endoglucanase
VSNKLCSQEAPLYTKGPNILDAQGKIFIIKGVNWWGTNGSLIPYSIEHSKGTDTHSMPFGLHVQKLEVMVNAIYKAGFNTVRLPFSNEMLHDTTRVKQDWIGPNIQLIGLRPIEVLDSVVKALTDRGIFVLLNNHSTTSHWCCNYDFNGLWFGRNKFYSQTTQQWIDDWVMLAERYKQNKRVIGADLRNEVRPARGKNLAFPRNPNWGQKNRRDWHRAATLAGNAIHKLNQSWLIVVEGINARVHFFSKLTFPLLKPIQHRPVILNIPNKLIYEVHNYSFGWIKANVLNMKRQVRYMDVSTEERLKQFNQGWGFVKDTSFVHCAPVILGEFGCSSLSPEVEPWLKDLSEFVVSNQIGFCWWTLEEELYNDGSYGILNSNLDSININTDWRWVYLKKMLDMTLD